MMKSADVQTFGVWLDSEQHPHARMPERAHTTDAGWDLFSAEDVSLTPGERTVAQTGICLQLAPGWECQIRPRSGLAAKQGITVVNSPGTIDADYTGYIMVILLNTGTDPVELPAGSKVAQMVFKRIPRVELSQLAARPTNESRGASGLGSTGV